MNAHAVSTIRITAKKNLVLSLAGNFQSSTVLAESDRWESVFTRLFDLHSIEEPVPWSKLIAHGVPVDHGNFQTELETFNSARMKGEARWLTPLRDGQKAGSVIFWVEKAEARRCLQQGVDIAGVACKVVPFNPQKKAQKTFTERKNPC